VVRWCGGATSDRKALGKNVGRVLVCNVGTYLEMPAFHQTNHVRRGIDSDKAPSHSRACFGYSVLRTACSILIHDALMATTSSVTPYIVPRLLPTYLPTYPGGHANTYLY
jgi:hypothetical protein